MPTVKRHTWTSESLIEHLSDSLGPQWDCSSIEYVNTKTPVTVRCYKHSTLVSRTPAQLLRGEIYCPSCFLEQRHHEWVEASREVWGDRWDYSDTEYVESRAKVKIRCREHGYFWQRPKNHLQSVGCPECARENNRLRNVGTLESFISKAREVWGDRWDYTHSEYQGRRSHITITCKEHGDFLQFVEGHLEGQVGCKWCREYNAPISYSEFVRRSVELWGEGRWDIFEESYTSYADLITFRCLVHDRTFTQRGADHLRGNSGCVPCSRSSASKAEDQIAEFIESKGISVERNVRNLIPSRSLEVDIYLPSCQVAIEYNGVYWHSEKFVPKEYHSDKRILLKEQGIRLVQIWEDDWHDRTDIVKRHLEHILDVPSTTRKVNGRDVSVREISYTTASQFLTTYHIQGASSGTVYLGLFDSDDSLVAVGVFKSQGTDYVLVRYATSCLVRGGHSKLIRYFERNYTYGTLITFADLSYSEGDLYRKTGWTETKVLPPDYSYTKCGGRHHKFGYRKSRFKDDPKLIYKEGLSERQLSALNGLHRVYDSGKIRFEKRRSLD